ncbi:CHASE2 domain-containing protein [Mastigocoleus testarum]|uniref:Sensor protein Chase2 n=1 Tax=Mastigocoleus testarum BC008 TaxID=371196 RepID=A0A0V7ZXV7_9CYAN|nr:CHASE2 domain-containing protein [Mastigocoleus testarum]KST69392.1 sensor protein Chase2 [Mastigocoleus testarum BC008]
MNKLVVLKFGKGSFEEGFPAIFQIGEENAPPSTEVMGELPANEVLPQTYRRWQEIYSNMSYPGRPIGVPKGRVRSSTCEECLVAAQKLNKQLNNWLKSSSFLPIREKWLEKLLPSDDLQVIIQTQNYQLQKLPWHLWDIVERYPKVEIGLSSPSYDRVFREQEPVEKVKILAILGNSTGIDIEADKNLLAELPNADINFMVEPPRSKLTEELWEQKWQILFFAGHSFSQADGESGRIYINQNQSLTIGQLKYALRKAVDNGLKLAIFNSCDGLGLAKEFADLKIPYLIVMREVVPDQVAQEFLKSFLKTFVTDIPLYRALREARERLQGLESKFPCASWLPIIYQHQAETPLTWKSMIGTVANTGTNRNAVRKKGLKNVLFSSLVVSSLVVGMRLLGLLQTLELQAFDQMMKLRPSEGIDERLLLITINDADIEAQRKRGEELKGVSLSDKSLERTLEILQKYQPSVIGLDVYRDFKTNPKYKKLIAGLKNTENLIGICKVSSVESDPYGVRPPKEFPVERLGFSDFIDDRDNVLRRHLLSMNSKPSSHCQSLYALSLQLASRYLLQIHNVQVKLTSDRQNWQIGNVVFHKLKSRSGGYQGIDANSEQILLNYRAGNDIAQKLTLQELFDAENNSEALEKFIKDKVILIGITENSNEDRWLTPYGKLFKNQMFGVEAQAHMVSQILAAVLDRRPLIGVLPVWGDILFIWAWSLVGGSIAGLLCWRKILLKQLITQLGLAFLLSCGILYSVCFYILIKGTWLAFTPSCISLLGSISIVFLSLKNNK